MLKLAVFSLPAVIRFDELELRRLLAQCLSAEEAKALAPEQLPDIENTSQLILQAYESVWQKLPGNEKLERINKAFKKSVKRYFIDNDEAFEIRPGVQSLFGHMEKEKNWKYCIISNYPQEVTHLILQSCGVFSKNKLTITASDALQREDQLQLARKRAMKKSKKLKMYLFCGTSQAWETDMATTISPKMSKGSPNYFSYPRFGELFGKKTKGKGKKEKPEAKKS